MSNTMKLKNLLYILFIAVTIVSCRKDEIIPEETIASTTITTTFTYEEVNGTIIGFVNDVNGDPIANALIKYYGGQTTTNEYGLFSFIDMPMDRQGTKFVAEKSGYISHHTMLYPDGNILPTRIVLSTQSSDDSFNSQDGVVFSNNEVEIKVSPSSIIKSSGSIYTGEVKLLHDLKSQNDVDSWAGGNLGIDENGRHRVIGFLSQLDMHFIDETGAELKIRTGSKSSISLNGSSFENIPSDVTLWYYDEVEMFWIKKGLVTIEDGKVNFDIDSPGTWGIGVDYEPAQVCGEIKLSSQVPAADYDIIISHENLIVYHGYTDNSGTYCGKIPRELELDILVSNPICQELSTETILSPLDNLEEPQIVYIESSSEVLTGNVKCNDNPFQDAIVIIEKGEIFKAIFPNIQGEFVLSNDLYTCDPNEDKFIYAINNETLEVGPKIILDDPQISLLFDVCDIACLLEAGIAFESTEPCLLDYYTSARLNVTGGSGNYSISWANGISGEEVFGIEDLSEICATVYDNDSGCEEIFCFEVPTVEKLDAFIEVSYDNCEENSGRLSSQIFGGTEPITTIWEGPNGYTSTDLTITNLYPGVYTLSIKDGNNCELQLTEEIKDATSPLNFNIKEYCDVVGISIDITGGQGPFDYQWSGGEVVQEMVFVSEPGEYCVTVTDANSCSRTGCVSIFNIESVAGLNIIENCEEELVILEGLNGNFIYNVLTNDETFPIDVIGGVAEVSILDAGYEFELEVMHEEIENCIETYEIIRPHFEGLTIDKVSPSCDTCDDGQIYVLIDNGALCNECELGTYKIIRKDTQQDVTNINDALSIGVYVIYVYDEISGCVVAHEILEI